MHDRFTRGFVAGALAGIAPFVINHSAYALKLTSLRWVDFLGIFITGSRPSSLGALVFALVAEFILLGVFGIFFAYLVPLVTSVNYLLKGFLYGASIWFIAYFVTITLRPSGFAEIPLNTAVTNLVAGIIWGLTLSIILKRVDRLVKSH